MPEDKLNELIVPPIVLSDPKAYEVARIWVAHKGQHVTLNMVWDDPAAWGIMLVDFARHVANFFHQEKGFSVDAVMERLKEGFDAEWSHHTTDIAGQTLDPPPVQ
jgi:hypothetical protein